jgi:peptidoglycan hydrolase-like protein with peptidoglycan-binding domain
MTKRIVTAACALALGLAWTMAPAIAADESMKDKAKDKMDTAKDKVGSAVDKTKEKTSEVAEKTKDKAVEVKDKTKETAGDIKDTIRNKVTGRKGSDTVRQAQQALMDKGISPGPIDGKMGPQTKAALSEYQKKENLKVTGRLDGETKAKLINGSVSTKTDTSTPAASPTTTTAPSLATTPPTGAPADSNANVPKKQSQ